MKIFMVCLQVLNTLEHANSNQVLAGILPVPIAYAADIAAAAVALPKADITGYTRSDCTEDGEFSTTKIIGAAPGTCFSTSIVNARSVKAVANVPPGYTCTLQLFRGSIFCTRLPPQAFITTGDPNICISVPSTAASIGKVLWDCEPPLPPGGYPLADVTVYSQGGCGGLVPITDPLTNHKYEDVKHNVCYPATGNSLPPRLSARAKLAVGQPMGIYPGYKCELSLYALLSCPEQVKIVVKDNGAPDTCADTKTKPIQSFKWRCGLK
jgi:hypothetical protein